MKIKINGIFHKYNNIIDLDKKISIYIGENGVGKTTTMNILYCILTGDFANIIKYSFESIDIDNVHINYEDLIPSIDDIFKDISKKDRKILSDFYNDYFRESYYDKDYSPIIYNKLLKLDYFGDKYYKKYNNINSKHNGLMITYNEDLVSNHYEKPDDCLDFIYRGDFKYLNKSTFVKDKNHSKLENKLKLYLNSVIKHNMLENNNIVNDVLKHNVIWDGRYSTHVCNKEFYNLDWYTLNYLSEYEDCWDDEQQKFIRRPMDRLELDNNKLLHKVYKKYLTETSIEEIVDRTTFYSTLSYSNISQLIIKNFYPLVFVKEINRDYYTWLKHIYLDEKEELEKGTMFSDVESLNKLEHYLIPFLPNDSVFNCEEVLFSKQFYNFYKNEINKIINYTNSKIEKINELLGRYFKNKRITVCPSGLIISLSNNKYVSDLNVYDLSEGERRLLMLLILSVINETKVLVLDELEASLSIVWQKTIINDLIEYSNVENIVVATQSPFIVPDELMDNIICLPGDENEK